MNVSLPGDLVAVLRQTLPAKSISKFLADAAAEKMARVEQEQALRELLAGPIAFENVDDSVAYVREMRQQDEQREKRLGL